MTVLDAVLLMVIAMLSTGMVVRFFVLRARYHTPDRALQSEVIELRARVEELQTKLNYEREERSRELIEAYRRIGELEKKETQLQEIIAELRGTTDAKPVTVLGIWSGDNLDTVAERDAIYNAGFEYRPLFGDDATRVNIMRELRQGSITIIEIGAHGDAEAIFVKGEELTAGWWHRALLGRNVRVAIILACFSDNSVASAFLRSGVPSVIAVTGEIEDKAAVEFAQQFYQLYADGMPVKEAFDQAKLILDNSQAEKLVFRTRFKI